MNDLFEHNPPIPTRPSESFIQTILLHEGDQTIGRATWASAGQGVVQLVHLEIDPGHGRRGRGGQLLDETIRQAQAYQRRNKKPLRRVWIMLEQKSQIIGRAFLTAHGFHHVGTVTDLFRGEDALMYVKSFD